MNSQKSIRVVTAGGGSWGTALSHAAACAGNESILLLRDEKTAAAVQERHENPRYLPGLKIHHRVEASTSADVLSSCDILVLAIPAQQQRKWLESVKNRISPETILVNAAKGLELPSATPLSVLSEQILQGRNLSYAVLSGPSFAEEVMKGLPTAVVLGCRDEETGRILQESLSSPSFRCYTSSDVLGVEMGGALKNVMAIAAGLCDGLNMGQNAKAALVTRGLAELTRIGTSMGASPMTFMGLSGLGDLVLTCNGSLSRNRKVGMLIGQGLPPKDAEASLGMVAEGIATAEAALVLADRLQVEAPVVKTVCRILHQEITPREAASELMGRSLKNE